MSSYYERIQLCNRFLCQITNFYDWLDMAAGNQKGTDGEALLGWGSVRRGGGNDTCHPFNSTFEFSERVQKPSCVAARASGHGTGWSPFNADDDSPPFISTYAYYLPITSLALTNTTFFPQDLYYIYIYRSIINMN